MTKIADNKIWGFLVDFLAINFGMAVYSLGWAAFLLPYHITTGGMAGMFAIVYYVTGFPMSYAILLANGVLLIFALWQIGWKFTLKSAYAAVALSVYLEMGQSLVTDSGGNLMQLLGEGQDSMACVLGAVLNGLGIGIVFLSGGSTAGWDIIAAIVNKYRNISLGRVLLYLDFLVIASCWPLFHDWRMVVFGYVTLAICTYVLDLVINSATQDVQFVIFTNKPDEICERIITETSHSVTSMDGVGYYSKESIKVLVTIVHKRESVTILRMIKETDPAAFVSQSRVEGVYGKGFKAIRA